MAGVWAALALGAAAWFVFDALHTAYRAESAQRRAVLVARGQTLLDALRAGIFAQGRMGQQRGDRLSIVFEELSASPDVHALALRGPGGELVALGGSRDDVPDRVGTGHRWTKGRLVVAREVDFADESRGAGGGRGRGFRGGTEQLGLREGVHELVAVLDVGDVELAIRRDRARALAYAGIAAVALLLAAATLRLLVRRSELGAALRATQERAQRQEQAARLGAGLAHETKNPLGIVRGLAQAIGDSPATDAPDRERARQIVDEVDRVIGGIDSFLAVSRPPAVSQSTVDLDTFFAGFLPLVQADAAAADATLAYRPCGVRVAADEGLLRRALLNLILNALRASSRGRTVAIEARREGRSASLDVVDEGCGIAPEDLARITEPYFTRFPGGTGLGLAIVAQIAAAHGWELRIESEPGRGTRATLANLPVVEGA